MGNPLSIATASGPAKFVKISMRPSPSAREAGTPPTPISLSVTYSMSVNPSDRSNSPATYCGLRHTVGTFPMRMRVVSGGGSAKAVRDGNPRRLPTPAAPTAPIHLRRLRFIVPPVPRVRAGTYAPDHALSSRLSSLRNRQSVPWAMIFWGVVLIIPASWSRRA